MAQTIFYLILIILVFDYFLERLLELLNNKRRSAHIPAEMSGYYNEEKYAQAQNYDRVKTRYSALSSTISLALMILMLTLGGFGWLDQSIRTFTGNDILLAIYFFGILGLSSSLLSIPFSAYRTFVIEERFGFNNTNVRTFITDILKGWLLAAVLGGGLIALVVWIYSSTGSWFWLLTWGVVGFFMVFMTMFYSNLIVPLFNKQSPLEPGELRTAIESFADKVGFKLNNIYVMDGSKRSTKANAYFTGLGRKKRIVLFDTLIQDHSTDELVGILAHEVGHYKKKHTLSGTLLSLMQVGVMLYILSLFIGIPELSMSIGAITGSFHMGVLAFGLLYSPLSMVLGLIINGISRKNEFAADRYAGENFNPTSLKNSPKKAIRESFEQPDPTSHLRIFLLQPSALACSVACPRPNKKFAMRNSSTWRTSN